MREIEEEWARFPTSTRGLQRSPAFIGRDGSRTEIEEAILSGAESQLGAGTEETSRRFG